MIELYINNTLVDIDQGSNDSFSILLQKTRTDYTNPTIVKNSFTKTVSLPGTDNNNKLFNQIWKLDRTQWKGAFNPSYRAPFLLLENGSLVECGYVKLDSVKINKTNTYDCTFYGELGNILYGLTYRTNEETQDTIPLTLGDLIYERDLKFGINKDVVLSAWRRLDNLDSGTASIYDTINFAVCYDGIPDAENFDPKKILTSVKDKNGIRVASVFWDGETYLPNDFPQGKTVDGKYYGYLNLQQTRSDPEGDFILAELKNGITPIEARDFRSYLNRPILRVKKVFEAIGRYMTANLSWELDLSDPFFDSEEYKSQWITLSMLSEINPNVESGTVFTQSELLSNTSSPSSYLISYCKIYGIYIEPDIQTHKLKLIRLPRFFSDKVTDLKLDLSQGIEVTPLSFDKSSYTFDYGEGQAENVKAYKEKYGIAYGSKKVNTGYRFDASTAKYINNNIFNIATDAIEQSGYYKFNFDSITQWNFPVSVAAQAEPPEMKYFRVDQTTHKPIFNDNGSIDSYGSTMTRGRYSVDTPIQWGYEYADNRWNGLTKGIWNDTHARLQFHGENNKATDGKNVLIRYNGKSSAKAGYIVSYNSTPTDIKSDDNIFVDNVDFTSGNRNKLTYLVSDDNPFVKQIVGSNCYYDKFYMETNEPYLNVIDSLPLFNRVEIDYSSDYISFEKHSGWSDSDVHYVSTTGTTTTTGDNYITSSIDWSMSYGNYGYISFPNYQPNHNYLIISKMRSNVKGDIYIRLVGGTVKYYNTTLPGNYGGWKLTASICNSTLTTPRLRIYNSNTSGTVETSVAWITVIDLDKINLYFTSPADALKYFKYDQYNNYGFPYMINNTLDFGTPREIFIPATSIRPEIDIYNRYWSRYISDVYNVNTRIIKCKAFIQNIQNAFREFYYYDNSLWILSKVEDWNSNTKLCNATFTKVNDKKNYLE